MYEREERVRGGKKRRGVRKGGGKGNLVHWSFANLRALELVSNVSINSTVNSFTESIRIITTRTASSSCCNNC